jgi:hypothetical protein
MAKSNVFNRGVLYFGIIILAIGILATLSVLWNVWFTQSLCESGLSPQPVQGCGYVPQMVLFAWGAYTQWPTLLFGLIAIYVAAIALAGRWAILRRHKVHGKVG